MFAGIKKLPGSGPWMGSTTQASPLFGPQNPVQWPDFLAPPADPLIPPPALPSMSSFLQTFAPNVASLFSGGQRPPSANLTDAPGKVSSGADSPFFTALDKLINAGLGFSPARPTDVPTPDPAGYADPTSFRRFQAQAGRQPLQAVAPNLADYVFGDTRPAQSVPNELGKIPSDDLGLAAASEASGIASNFLPFGLLGGGMTRSGVRAGTRAAAGTGAHAVEGRAPVTSAQPPVASAPRVASAPATEIPTSSVTVGDLPGSASYEIVPGVGTGHFPKVNERPTDAAKAAEADALRTAYSLDPRSKWDVEGQDLFYRTLGRGGETRRVQGAYVAEPGPGVAPTAQPVVETNEGWVTRPIVKMDSPFELSRASQNELDAVERLRSTVDWQNRGNWLVEVRPLDEKDINALKVPLDKSLTKEQMGPIARQADAHGLFVTNRGSDLLLIPKESPRIADEKALVDGPLGRAIQNVLGPVAIGRGKFISGNIGNEAALAVQNQNRGLATEKLLESFRQAPEVRAALEKEKLIRDAIEARLARDRDWSKDLNDLTRPDRERLLKTLLDRENWERALDQALRRSRDKMPAALPPMVAGTYEASSPDDN
jgi:hypothetical protein